MYCFLANVNVDGKNLRQIEKDKYSTALTDRPLWPGEEWGESEKDWVEKVGKGNGGCFSCSYDRIVGAGRRLVFFYPVKGIWLIFKGSP